MGSRGQRTGVTGVIEGAAKFVACAWERGGQGGGCKDEALSCRFCCRLQVRDTLAD